MSRVRQNAARQLHARRVEMMDLQQFRHDAAQDRFARRPAQRLVGDGAILAAL